MSSRKKFAGFLLVAVCLVGGELLSFSHPTEIACMQLQMDRLKKRTDRPRPLEEGGELFQPGPLRQTRGIQRCATQAPPVARCGCAASAQEHTATGHCDGPVGTPGEAEARAERVSSPLSFVDRTCDLSLLFRVL